MVVHFSLSEEGVTALREALTCLSKFSDEVSLEAKRDRVRVLRLVMPPLVHLLTTLSSARLYSSQLVQVGLCEFLLLYQPLLHQISV